jgi:hypothetical protein
MNLSLKKYFSFGYFNFIIPLFKSGMYRLDSFDDNQLRIMRTTFYIDGDASTELYPVSEESENLLVEQNEEKVIKHMQIVEEKVATMDVFYTQIQLIIGFIGTLITFFTAQTQFNFWPSVGITIGLGTFFILIRKYVLKVIIWTVKNIVIPLIQKKFTS